MEAEELRQQKSQGASGRSSKLSLRRKKDKDPPLQHPPPIRKAASNFTLQITPCDSPSKPKGSTSSGGEEGDGDADTASRSEPVRTLKPLPDCSGSNSNVGLTSHGGDDGEKDTEEMAGIESLSPHHAEEGLGELFFCQICQKDLTRFSETMRQQHINRCCDKLEEESSASAAATKELESPTFSCLLCEKSFKSENVRLLVTCTCTTLIKTRNTQVVATYYIYVGKSIPHEIVCKIQGSCSKQACANVERI